jgi:hypothetical protein
MAAVANATPALPALHTIEPVAAERQQEHEVSPESAAAAEAVAASVDLVLSVLALTSPRTTTRAASACKSWGATASPLLRQLAASTFHPPYLKKFWSREMAAYTLSG